MAEYLHKSYSQLVLDKIRAIQFEIDVVKDYLQYDGRYDNSITQSLDECSTIMFDSVYKPLKDCITAK